jgi:outer membrane protein TolC
MKKTKIWMVALGALLLFQPIALFGQAQEGKPAQPVVQDRTLSLYKRLSQMVRSQLDRMPVATADPSKPLSLDDCLAIALHNNGQLLIARERLLASKMRYTEARKDLMPAAKFKGYIREGILTNKTFKGSNYKVEGSYDAYDGMHKFQALDQAKQTYMRTKKTYQSLRDNILYQTRQAYYQLYRSNTLYAQQTQLATKAQDLITRGKDMLEKKLLRNVDYLGLVSNFQQIHGQTLASGEELTLARMGLSQLLHYYPENPIEIEPLSNFQVLENVDLEECLTLAFQYRPDMAMARISDEIRRLGVDMAKSSTGLNVNLDGHFGHKGEDFNEAKEGIQSRPDLELKLKMSLPMGPHTFKYEPEFVKQVPNVGSTSSTLYNSHDFTFAFFNNKRKREILEAQISYHSDMEDFETLKKSVVSDVARRYLDLERTSLGLDTAQLTFQLAQERFRTILAQVAGSALQPGDELQGIMGVHGANQNLVNARISYLTAVADLNRSIGVDNYFDPFTGVINSPQDEPVHKIRKIWEVWKDDAVEQDRDLWPTKFYADYLRGAETAQK